MTHRASKPRTRVRVSAGVKSGVGETESGASASPLLTVPQVATRLSISRDVVRELLKSGSLVGIRWSKGGEWRIDPRDLDAFLARCRLQRPEASP